MKRILILATAALLISCGPREDVEVTWLTMVGVSESETYIKDGSSWRDVEFDIVHDGSAEQTSLSLRQDPDGPGRFYVKVRQNPGRLEHHYFQFIGTQGAESYLIASGETARFKLRYRVVEPTDDRQSYDDNLTHQIVYIFNDEDDDGLYGELRLDFNRLTSKAPGEFMPPCPKTCTIVD